MPEDVQTNEVGVKRDGGDRGGSQCPMCNADLFKRHCKYVCPQHGVVADCADPFIF